MQKLCNCNKTQHEPFSMQQHQKVDDTNKKKKRRKNDSGLRKFKVLSFHKKIVFCLTSFIIFPYKTHYQTTLICQNRVVAINMNMFEMLNVCHQTFAFLSLIHAEKCTNFYCGKVVSSDVLTTHLLLTSVTFFAILQIIFASTLTILTISRGSRNSLDNRFNLIHCRNSLIMLGLGSCILCMR